MFVNSRKNHLLVVLCAIIVSLIIVIWNFRFLFLAGGDQSLFINIGNIVPFITSFWDENFNYALGGQMISIMLLIPLVLPFYFLSNLLSPLVVQYLYFTGIFSSIFLLSYWFFYRYHFKSIMPSVAASSLSILNLFFFVSYINYNIHLSFLILPILLSLCHELVDRNIKFIIVYILFLSFFMPAIFSNLPAAVPLFFMTIIYFLYLLLTSKKSLPEIAKSIGLSVAIVLITFSLNIWWIYPLINSLLVNNITAIVSAEVVNMFRTTSLYDALRFLGGWAFNSFGLNFNKGRYDGQYVTAPLFIISSFVPVIAAFAGMFFYKKSKHILFFFLFALLSLSLVKGDINPFGQWYSYLWKNVPGMIIFREPYTKFMQLYVFSLAGLFGYFLHYLPKTLEKEIKWSLYAVIIAGIGITSLPFFFGGFIPMRFHAGNQRSYLVKVPDYIKEYEKYINKKKLESRTVSYPQITQAYLWESGFNIDDTVLKYFSRKPTISDIKRTHYQTGIDTLIQDMYRFVDQKEPLTALFGSMNVGYVALERDKDWRWNKEVRKPSQMNIILSQLEKQGLVVKEKDFGLFSQEYLAKIPKQVAEVDAEGKKLTEAERITLEEEVNKELLNQPALTLYKVHPQYLVNVVYTPSQALISNLSVDYIHTIKPQVKQAVFLKSQLQEFQKEIPVDFIPPSLEFHKINPTKYEVKVHKAQGNFPLILSQSYHDGWKAYLTKYQTSNIKNQKEETLNTYEIIPGNEEDQATKQEVEKYGKEGMVSETGEEFISKSFNGTVQNDNLKTGPFFETWLPGREGSMIPDENHLVVNGYANSWIIEPSLLCDSHPTMCHKNRDGSYEMALTLEFYPQRWFVIAIGVSIVTGLILIVIYYIQPKKKHEK